jgi:hypothetical protein
MSGPETKITFDASTHQYTVDGRRVPHVTAVLNDLIPCFRADDWYLERGRAVHACAALIAEGKAFSNDPQIDGQVSACRRWFSDFKPTVIGVEIVVASRRYQYAGTADMCCSITGSTKLIVVDWKASISKSLPYQLAAYSLAFREMGHVIVNNGVGVQLSDDGSYKMTDIYDLRKYEQKWLGLLTAYNVRRECGVDKKEETK